MGLPSAGGAMDTWVRWAGGCWIAVGYCCRPSSRIPTRSASASPPFAAFEGPFLPVAGKLAVLVFSAAQIRLGLSLVRQGQPDRRPGFGSAEDPAG